MEKKLKVLVVLYSLGRGGAETIMYNYIKFLKENEDLMIDILIHKSVMNGYEIDASNHGINILKIETINTIGMINYCKKLIKIIENGYYDTVHFNLDGLNGIGAICAKKAKIKNIICHSHSTGAKKTVGFLVFYFNRLLMKMSHCHYLACGKDAGKSLFGNNNFYVLNNGIDTYVYSKLKDEMYTRNLIGVSKDCKIVIHIGRFDEAKNQIFLVNIVDDIVRINQKIHFVFVGDGILFEEVKKIAGTKKFYSHIHFLGIRKDIPELLFGSNLFAMPSIYEGLPVTLIEAQCAGLPILLSSAITKEGNCSINVIEYHDLQQSEWINAITKLIQVDKTDIFKSIENIGNCGFDIEKNTTILKSFYEGEFPDDKKQKSNSL